MHTVEPATTKIPYGCFNSELHLKINIKDLF